MSVHVYYEREPLGSLRVDGSGQISFAYTDAWLQSPSAFPLSVSMPLQRASYGQVAHNFFANLLPEGTPREQLANRFGISTDNDFSLLERIGGECAGAISIAAKPPEESEEQYEQLDLAALVRASKSRSVLAALAGERGTRLSLAGAQDKLPILYDAADRKIWKPLYETPSTHILKFPSSRFKRVPENEAFIAHLARRLQIETADTALVRAKGYDPCLLVKRYDRIEDASGNIHRLHQEDFCQALGVSPRLKYEKEGGPSLRDCVDVIKRHSAIPALDKERLIDWIVFNVVIGNADAHAKNVSLLYQRNGAIRLAPFYDMLCTHAYPTLGKECAMSIGGQADPGRIARAHWEAAAREISVRRSYLLERVESIATACRAAADDTAQALMASFGVRRERLEQTIRYVKRQARRTLSLLAVKQ